MINKAALNNLTWESVKHYQNLQIGSCSVNTPYYINNIGGQITNLLKNAGVEEENIEKVHSAYKNKEIPYGWYRGKGSPQELEEATQQISKIVGVSLKNANSQGIAEFMKLYGLGVDCSGFIFHVLSYAFNKIGSLEEFHNSLAWTNPEIKIPSYAGAFVFAGIASEIIEPKNVQPLDMLLSGPQKGYTHISLILEQKGQLQLVQSNLDCIPTGINISKFEIEDEKPKFYYKPTIASEWNTYWDKGILEFRRLKILF